MSLSDLASIGTLASGVAVFVSLIYLGSGFGAFVREVMAETEVA